MEFSNELNFLSVIEEERESACGDSLEETEKLKWKTDYKGSESSFSNRIGVGDRKLKEKIASKIPIRQDRLQMPGNIVSKEIQEIHNEHLTSFQEHESDEKHENIPAVKHFETNSSFSCPNTENGIELQISELLRVVDISVSQDKRNRNGEHRGNSESLTDNANISEQNWLHIERLNVETRNSSISDVPDTQCTEREYKIPTSLCYLIESSEGKKSGIKHESNAMVREEELSVSVRSEDYCSNLALKGVNVLREGDLQNILLNDNLQTSESYQHVPEEYTENERLNIYVNNRSLWDSDYNPSSTTTRSQIIDEINATKANQDVAECIFGSTNYLSAISDDSFAIPNATEFSGQNYFNKEAAVFEIKETIAFDNKNTLSNTRNSFLQEEDLDPVDNTNTLIQKVEHCLIKALNIDDNVLMEEAESSEVKTTELNKEIELCQDTANIITSITSFFSNSESVDVPIEIQRKCIINAEHMFSSEHCTSEIDINICVSKSPQSYVSNSEHNDCCNNLCINLYSLDIKEYPSECHDSEDNILEAPAEFRTYFANEEFMPFKVSPPQPPSVPEKESPICDHHNNYVAETDDTIQRPKPTGEHERYEKLKITQENRRTQVSNVSNLSSTDSVLPAFTNSTEDNDHVKQEGGNRNVSAFEHVGNNAPIQRHDMLQIDRSERGEIVDRIVSNSAVLDLRSNHCRSLGRSASFNDRFSSCVNSGSSTKTDKDQHEILLQLQKRLEQALDLKLSSAHHGNFSVNEDFTPSENSVIVNKNHCTDVNNISNFAFYRNNHLILCGQKSESDKPCDVIKLNSDIYNAEQKLFCENNMEEVTNHTDYLRPDGEVQAAWKQDNNNNLSGGICNSDEEISHEKDESSAVFYHFADTSDKTTPASFTVEERNTRAPIDAHLSESRFPKLFPSIHGEFGVPAPAPGCSPTKTAALKGCVGSRQNSTSGFTSCSVGDEDHADEDVQETENLSSLGEIHKLENLRWSFKNGRLVFDSDNSCVDNKNAVSRDLNSNEVNLDSIESTDYNPKLSSKEVNKRIDENKSRLRYLEEKLKRAGLGGDSQTSSDTKKDSLQFKSDVAKQVVDESDSTLWEELKENENCGSSSNTHEDEDDELQEDSNYGETYAEELKHFTGAEEFCQFDVSQVGSFSPILNGYCLVYDELNEQSDSDEEFHVISLQEDPNSEEEFYVISNNSTKLSDKMGTDSDRPKHNPDTENLRSLLKRPGKNKDKKSNRVVFNENKNEFFDADYIILIREECDYDDEDDDSVCTCNQHEMVRLTCCEPNCNCSVYDGYDPTPQSPKFAPPLEFVDAVTLSPPEGYKDMELGEQQLLALQQMARRGQQRRAVCRECSATHNEDDDGEGSQSDEGGGHHTDSEETGEREKTDQSQQTTPTTPDICTGDSSLHDFTVDCSPMTVSENTHSLDEDSEEYRTESSRSTVPAGGSPISGILKGGKLWKQSSLDGGSGANVPNKSQELQQNTDSSITSDEEGCPRRFVRFIDSEVKDQRGGCDGASDDHTEEDSSKEQNAGIEQKKNDARDSSAPHDSTEMMLTFKLGNHVLISNNSLKPNSAVRQLFPCTKPSVGKDEESIQQYLVTAESLRAFEEAKRSKLPQIIQNGETDESIKKAIERNTLRRSLIRYEPRSKKNQPKTDNSLVERIKQLTCDVDDDLVQQEEEEIQVRASPPGEEARNSPEITAIKQQDKSFSPSSSSTASSNSSSVSSTYKKITDLFNKKTDKLLDGQNNLVTNTVQETKITPTLPDLGNGPHEIEHVHLPVSRINSCTNESRKQFLASLAPLTACVSGVGNTDDYFYQMNNHHDHGGQRTSLASSVGTEYSLEDIDEALRNDQEDTKRITPDVLAGTPSASESGDELAMFVQQDAGRIERIKKKYQPESNKEEDDEHDDYGFNKRPSVRGIKPRFGTTTQIIQQIQNQMQPPDPAGRVSWPYYSESGLSNIDNSKTRNSNQNITYQYPPAAPDDFKSRGYQNSFRPTSLTEESMYQSGQFCKQMYRTNGNTNNYPAVVKLGARCNDMYQSLPRQKTTGRPSSPPPLEMSKTYHQTMVYIPYNHIDGCQGTGSPNMYYQQSDYARVSNQNQINKRFIEPIYQQRFHMHLEDHYSTNIPTSNLQKQMIRIPYPPQHHGINCRSESPLPGQFSTARSTQTPLPNCNYYTTQRYRPIVGSVWQGDPAYVSKMNRHSFPMSQRYTTSDTSTDTDSSQGIASVQNGYRQSVEISLASQKDNLGNSPIKPKFTERGVPEGAASVSPPDTIKIGQSSSTMTSPTSPQNASMQTQKPLFYAMNV